MEEGSYICIDLKSFYASVECVERGLDPMTTRLVVADPERAEGTICLAVSPALKSLGIKNRSRVYEIPKSVDYIMAVPRMQKYIDYAAAIYGTYLDHIAAEDIHVYSIDEAFMYVKPYISLYERDARGIALMIMESVKNRFGIRATAGIGTNLYLTKVALDIMAKHSRDFTGFLDEETYKRKLWRHRPLTDFWRIGRATDRALEHLGLRTMEQIAHADEERLYRRFGIDAELLIDHAWGRETVTIKDIKKYRPKSRSLSSGQVLMRDYTRDEARIVLCEMTDQLCLDMTKAGLITGSVTVYVGYSHKYGIAGTRGTAAFCDATDSAAIIVPEVMNVYDRITYRDVPVRRLNVACNGTVSSENRQLTFTDETDEKARCLQTVINAIKDRYGKNAVFKAMDMQDCATALERNRQIGGHKSGV